MAAQNPLLYGNHDWVGAVLARGTESAALKILELANADPRVMGRHGGYAHERQLKELLSSTPGLRATLLARYKTGEFRAINGPVEKALASSADKDTVLAMVEVRGPLGATTTRELHEAIESAVIERRPISGNSYELHGINAAKLRKALFGMIDGPSGALAQACLVQIDKIRDEHGRVEFEPRHPDSDSKRPWPFVGHNSKSDSVCALAKVRECGQPAFENTGQTRRPIVRSHEAGDPYTLLRPRSPSVAKVWYCWPVTLLPVTNADHIPSNVLQPRLIFSRP